MKAKVYFLCYSTKLPLSQDIMVFIALIPRMERNHNITTCIHDSKYAWANCLLRVSSTCIETNDSDIIHHSLMDEWVETPGLTI